MDLRIKKLDFKPPKLDKVYFTKVGDRSYINKEKIKKDAGYKCAKCKRKFHSYYLHVDHKRAIHTYKKGDISDHIATIHIGQSKLKQKYDNPKNYQVLCIKHHNEKSGKETRKRIRKKRNNPLNCILKS